MENESVDRSSVGTLDGEAVVDGLLESGVIVDSTRKAIARALGIATARGESLRPSIEDIEAACNECGARLAPTAAGWGYARDQHDREWLDLFQKPIDPETTALLQDIESVAAIITHHAMIGIAVRTPFFHPALKPRAI